MDGKGRTREEKTYGDKGRDWITIGNWARKGREDNERKTDQRISSPALPLSG